MYLDYFNLTEQPFSITPDPRFLYMSARHREALAHLLYGLGEGGGFVQLTGEVGTGKTTVCRCLLEQVPDNVDVALVLNPKVTAQELLATVCDELGISHPGDDASIKTLIDLLNRYLLDAHARGRRTVLIIDEAQNLSRDVLEQVRLLTNLETATQKLLQIILIGQPELREQLSREDMRQLSQRITARYHLEPISREEADAYIRHRLQICGSSQNLFTPRAVERIHKLSEGIPRLINVLCDRALLGTYVEGKGIVDRKIVNKASSEVLAVDEQDTLTRRPWMPLLSGALVVLLLAGAAYYYRPWQHLVTPVILPAGVDTTQTIDSEVPGLEAEVPGTGATIGLTDPEVSVEVAPRADAAVPVSLGDLLQQADSTWYRLAWEELFARWQVTLPPSARPDFCDYAREYGLYCLIGQGDWNTLRSFDRPAVLTLVREDGERVPVFLPYMEDSNLELVVGGEPYRLQPGQVGNYWYGEYVVLILAPPGGRLLLKTGDRDPDVAWLREQFGIAQNVKIPARDALLFDFPLQKQVLAFQRAHGLLTDGIVGKKTMIHLNSAVERENIPRLTGK
ncbi:MAG: AAA family ATPase [Gammaproteobacteria bacterium]